MPISLEVKGHIAYFTIEGQNNLNPMTPEMYKELYHHLLNFRDNENLWVGIITGKGQKAFSVGGDVKRMVELNRLLTNEDVSYRAWYPWSEPLAPFIAMESWGLELWKPIIAAVNGYCLGAGLLFLTTITDVRFAADHATFGFPEARLGLGGHGGFSGIARQIPYAAAMHLILSGDIIDAREAYRIGLINKVIPAKELMRTAEEYALRLCENSPLSMMVEKESTQRSLELPKRTSLRYTRLLNLLQRQLKDAYEGQDAFVEKRKPSFKGK